MDTEQNGNNNQAQPSNLSKRNIWFFTILFAVTGTLILATYFLVDSDTRPSSNKSEAPILPTPTPRSSLDQKLQSIAYTKNGEIWLLNPDNASETKINEASSGHKFQLLKWSPDREMVAYFEYEQYGREYWLKTVQVKTSVEQTIAHFTLELTDWCDNMSCTDLFDPFGWMNQSTIVFADRKTLIKYNLINNKREQLATANGEIKEVQFVDNYVYFSSDLGISRVNVETLEIEPLIDDILGEFEVSPNGEYMIFIKSDEQELKTALWLAENTGKLIRKLGVEGPCASFENPKFFPDSKKITYLGQCGDTLWATIYELDGKKVEGIDLSMGFWGYSWDPRGDRFVAKDRSPRYTIRIADESYIGIFNSQGELIKKLKTFDGDGALEYKSFTWGNISSFR